jgi:predicted DNA-binding protein (UPF0251 family)
VALQGTIGDFGLADIFQLIGMQRKSGILTLERKGESVRVRFVEGRVVGAENVGVKTEDLLGNVLVRTGRIAQSQLDEALALQRRTLQRLGYVLVEQAFLSEEALRNALQIQVEQIVYRLFRWREGDYQFDAQDHVEYDPNFTPIGAETILMEGARMVDEWPIIERRIPSDDIVLRRTAAAEAIVGPVESIVDADISIDITTPEGARAPAEVALSSEEREVLRLVDGTATVQEIAERLTFGEFDSYRILADLLTRSLVEKVEARVEQQATPDRNRAGRLATWTVTAVVFAAAAIGVATLPHNRYAPWDVAVADGATERLRTFASRGRLERIERAVRLFFLDTGQIPDGIDLLVANGYLSARDVLDPWGRRYDFRSGANSYTIAGLDRDGEADGDLTLTRRLSAAERRMMDLATLDPP